MLWVWSVVQHGADTSWVLAAALVDGLSVCPSQTGSTACGLVVIVHTEAGLDHHVAVEVLVSALLI